ncbi:hypothetical protein L911_1487 [Vibrio fluvialis I21563]|nr:hypothetical protein L911_1487 [Vibrio fluvialis I21563]
MSTLSNRTKDVHFIEFRPTSTVEAMAIITLDLIECFLTYD